MNITQSSTERPRRRSVVSGPTATRLEGNEACWCQTDPFL